MYELGAKSSTIWYDYYRDDSRFHFLRWILLFTTSDTELVVCE